jgi:hypothetical protein
MGKVQGDFDLFATVNLGGSYVNGASPIYQYTSQYVPPAGTPGLFASALDTPRGLAFHGGNLYVAINTTVDASVDPPLVQGSILKITPDGLMSTFATAFPFGAFLQGLATDSDGNLFVAGSGPNNPNQDLPSPIYKVALDGKVTSFATLPYAGWGLAFDRW